MPKQDPKIIFIEAKELKHNPHNARKHSKTQITQLIKSIQQVGFINPVVIDESKTVLAGHLRLDAAVEMGLNVIPCICIDYLDDAQKRAYMLADNKIALNAEWDSALLRVELDYLVEIDSGIDIEMTGFSTPEIDIILSYPDSEEPDEPPPMPSTEQTITHPGDIWQLGNHLIICGDSRDPEVLNKLMAGHQAVMVITDPPYNVAIPGHVSGLGKNQHQDFAMASGEMTSAEFITFLNNSLGQLAGVSTDGSLHYIFIDWRHLQELQTACGNIYDHFLNLCVWAKTNGGMGSLYRSQHELVLIYKKGNKPHQNNVQLGKDGRYRTNVWTYAGYNTFTEDRDEALASHPTVKPIRLIADAILDVTSRGDIVLDGFLGSGTTLVAAEHTGRICYGIEIDPRYVDVAIKRWIAVTGEQPVNTQSGKTFCELAECASPAETSEV